MDLFVKPHRSSRPTVALAVRPTFRTELPRGDSNHRGWRRHASRLHRPLRCQYGRQSHDGALNGASTNRGVTATDASAFVQMAITHR
jgi:hypothetical protein